ncbi:MAG TPA: hypothetical protein DGH68_10485 [Bacteroidetes bacterium]|jgi:hypothetical protein|nr:hypothetical protein [Bacteroidota bacterium]
MYVASAQISSQNADRHFITNARAAGMADAIVSDATDVSGLYWNPAVLSFLREGSLIFSYSLEKLGEGEDNIMNENLVAPVIDDQGWGLGIGATYSHVGSVSPGSPLSGYKYQQVGVDIGLATAITKFFSVGVTTRGKYGRVDSQSMGAMSTTFGICYFPTPGLSYGISYQGFGDGIEYTVDTLSAQTNIARFELPHSLQFGLTARWKALNEKPIVVLNVSSQKVLGINGAVYKGGVEYWPMDFLALRAGYWAGTDTRSARFGCGLRFDDWQLDYALSTTKREPRFHQFSLSYCFRSYSVGPPLTIPEM